MNCNFGTLRFWTTFHGLECFYRHSNSKTSNQKNQIYFVFVIRNIRLQCKDGKWTAGYYCINFKIVTFGNTLVIMNIELQHRGINFWIVTFGKIKILNNFSWTWMSPQTTNNIISPLGLNFEFPMGNNRRRLNWLHLTIYLLNGNSVQLIAKF